MGLWTGTWPRACQYEFEPELDLEESVNVMQEELTKGKQRAMDKRIAYKKAVEEFESGRAKSYNLAAKRFGVSDAVVRRMVYQSKASIPLHFGGTKKI